VQLKPKGWGAAYASAFTEQSVVDRYHLRPPYPEETFELLALLADGGPVLDAGCGPGDLARPLAARVERVDAVDVSPAMIERGRRLAGGRARNIRWIAGPIETAPLDPPYTLAVAGDSVHWFDWEVAPARLHAALAPDAFLAIVQRVWLRDERVQERLRPIYARHSSNPDFQPLDPVEELERRGLLVRAGSWSSEPAPWRPTLDEVVAVAHSMSGFALERMRDPAAFDAELGEALAALPRRAGRLELDVIAEVVWGRSARALS
jgi:SAM-dependent methyltransferase